MGTGQVVLLCVASGLFGVVLGFFVCLFLTDEQKPDGKQEPPKPVVMTGRREPPAPLVRQEPVSQQLPAPTPTETPVEEPPAEQPAPPAEPQPKPKRQPRRAEPSPEL